MIICEVTENGFAPHEEELKKSMESIQFSTEKTQGYI
jgi:hypothetical protein